MMTMSEARAAAKLARKLNDDPQSEIERAVEIQGWLVSGTWVFHRGNPGVWKFWYHASRNGETILNGQTTVTTFAKLLAEKHNRQK